MESVFSFLSSDNIASACLGILVSLLLYFVIQYKRTYSFWSSRGVHGPTPVPFFGNSLLYMLGSIPRVDYELGRRYGRVYGVYEGTIPALMVSDPEIVEKIFVSDHSSFKLQMESPSKDPLLANQIFFLKGDELKRVRGVITSALTGRKLRQFCQQVRLDDLNGFLAENAGKEVNLSPVFTLHLLNVVSRHFYGLHLDLFNNPHHVLVTAALGSASLLHFNNPHHPLVTAALGFGFTATQLFFVKNIPLLAGRIFERIRSTNQYLSSFVSYAVDERFKQFLGSSGTKKEERKEEREEEGKETKEKETKGRKKDLLQSMIDSNFSDIQLKANLIAMTKAGFGTTQTTLCFFCFEMAKNPEIQRMVQSEVDGVLRNREIQRTVQSEVDGVDGVLKNREIQRMVQSGVDGVLRMGEEEGRELVYEDLNNFPILDACFTEVLRLHPVDFRTFRRATAATRIPLTEIEVPANQLVKVPLHSLHFDAELFDDPFTFKPERWLDEELKNKKCFFMAFGAGPRMCPGSNFASLNAKLVMINILSRYTLELTPRTCLEIPPGRLAAAPENVWVKLIPRKEF